MNVTIYPNMKSQDFHHITLEKALDRIKSGNSKEVVQRVREAKTKDDADPIKQTLPCVCFSGKFGEKHTDDSLTEHSGFIVLDFDHLEDPQKRKDELCKWEYSYAVWFSPSGKGIKVLVKIAQAKEHRRHFASLKELFKEVDSTGVNVGRLCFESYDPDLYLNKESKVWTKIVKTEVLEKVIVTDDDYKIFQNLVQWLAKNGKAFVSGERNNFVFVLASACCRFGLAEHTAQNMISMYAVGDSSFSLKECKATVASAYRSNRSQAGTAEFRNGNLMTKNSTKEVEIELSHEDLEELNRQNIVFAEQVEKEAFSIYENGYEKVYGINIPELDAYYKRKAGELTCLTGYGNMGKSTYWMWYLMMRAIIFGEKTAIFSPESDPAADFYFDLTEMFFGCDCSKFNPNRPKPDAFKKGYAWVGEHFFNVSPSELSPTPAIIKQTFLTLVIGKDVKSVVVDPFNQLTNDYSSSGGRSDKYLETLLSDCSRFAKRNGVNFDIIAHPRTPREKTSQGDYECPDQFSIADGTMWNNKMDNILVYHRPFGFSVPDALECEIHSKKIRRQKTVGKRGFVQIEYSRPKRRFLVNGHDYMQDAIEKMHNGTQAKANFDEPVKATIRPNIHFASPESPYETDELDAKNYV
jgi:hypothetical protein